MHSVSKFVFGGSALLFWGCNAGAPVTTPPTPKQAVGDVLFREDFESGTGGWQFAEGYGAPERLISISNTEILAGQGKGLQIQVDHLTGKKDITGPFAGTWRGNVGLKSFTLNGVFVPDVSSATHMQIITYVQPDTSSGEPVLPVLQPVFQTRSWVSFAPPDAIPLKAGWDTITVPLWDFRDAKRLGLPRLNPVDMQAMGAISVKLTTDGNQLFSGNIWIQEISLRRDLSAIRPEWLYHVASNFDNDWQHKAALYLIGRDPISSVTKIDSNGLSDSVHQVSRRSVLQVHVDSLTNRNSNRDGQSHLYTTFNQTGYLDSRNLDSLVYWVKVPLTDSSKGKRFCVKPAVQFLATDGESWTFKEYPRDNLVLPGFWTRIAYPIRSEATFDSQNQGIVLKADRSKMTALLLVVGLLNNSASPYTGNILIADLELIQSK